MEFLRNTVIFNIPLWKFVLAMVAGLLGMMLIGCGVNVCWTRFGTHKNKKPPESPKQW